MGCITAASFRLMVITAAVLCLAPPQARIARADEAVGPAAAWLGALAGDWWGTGHNLGAKSNLSMEWEPVLSARFSRLTFRNTMAVPDQPLRVFEAHAYYRVTSSDSLAGTWFDNRGFVLPIRARATASSIEADWGSADTEQGRTIYRFVGENTLEVIDSVRTAKGMREFGRSRYRRVWPE